MSADVIDFPTARTWLAAKPPGFWTCYCGEQRFLLRANGVVYCGRCRAEQQRLAIVDKGPQPGTDSGA